MVLVCTAVFSVLSSVSIISPRGLLLMRRSRMFCQRGSNFDNFLCKLMRGPLNAGHYQPASETPHDGPTLNAGLVAFWFFARHLDQYC